jgi:hypothetical protein
MKKLTFAVAVLFCIAVIGTSCTKEQTTTAAPGTGMLSLELRVNNNEANDTLNSVNDDELVPAGTVIQFTMDTRDYQYNPDANYNYEMKTWTAVVGNDGMVSIELPAVSDDATVTVKYPDLSLTKTERIGFNNSPFNPARDTSYTVIYERSDDNYTIYDGADVKALDLLYSEK